MKKIEVKREPHEGFPVRSLLWSCMALAPLAPAMLLGSGPWCAGIAAGLPLMLLAGFFGYGY